MSNAGGPQRFEVLELNVGEMRVELSHTMEQIEQMMGMMQQLLQAKSADGGQQKAELGGTGRGEANDDSGGAGAKKRLLAQELAPQQQLLQGKSAQPQQQSVGWIKTCWRHRSEARGSGWHGPDD